MKDANFIFGVTFFRTDNNEGKNMTDNDKTILANTQEIHEWLIAQGFNQCDDLKLYTKTLPGGNKIHWDFRTQPKGMFYGWDKEGKMEILDDVALALPEYTGFRKRFTPSMPVKDAPVASPAPAQQTPVSMSPAPSEKQHRAPWQPKAAPQAPPASQASQMPQVASAALAEGQALTLREDEACTLMNAKDDKQILAEMEGKYLDEFVYDIEVWDSKKRKVRHVVGLSWAGVKETVRTAGHIEIDNLHIEETPEKYRILAKAKDTLHGITIYGGAEQAKMMKLKESGNVIEDVHAFSKCLSRAQRNALRSLIPEAVIKTAIDTYREKLKQGKVV
jgi:hypothetical protein